jgi:ribonucleoside-diphosphate reductase alpha chain
MWRSNENPAFRSSFSEGIFKQKYAHEGAETWEALAATLVEDVVKDRMTTGDKQQLIRYIADMKFIPGGRYLYYAGRKARFFNNCYLLPLRRGYPRRLGEPLLESGECSHDRWWNRQ